MNRCHRGHLVCRNLGRGWLDCRRLRGRNWLCRNLLCIVGLRSYHGENRGYSPWHRGRSLELIRWNHGENRLIRWNHSRWRREGNLLLTWSLARLTLAWSLVRLPLTLSPVALLVVSHPLLLH